MCRLLESSCFTNLTFVCASQWPPGLLDWLKWFDFALNLDFGVLVSPECVADFEDPSSAFVMRHVAMGAVLPVMCLCICFVYVLKTLWHGNRGTNVINPMVATWQITFWQCMVGLVFYSITSVMQQNLMYEKIRL